MRYCIVSDDDGHHYVIEAEYHNKWYELSDDEINDCPEWAYPCEDFSNVTFTDPEILGDKI